MSADARFGGVSARSLRLRFGVRSSVAGTFGVSIRNGAFARSWVGTITIAVGEINTDVIRTLVVPGDTTGTWTTDNTVGMWFGIALATGTTLQGVAGWQGGSVITTSAQTNLMATGGATFDLFDVGLYVDTAALNVLPPFQVPRFDTELERCKRYYEVFGVGQQFISAGAGNQQGQTISHISKRGTTTYAVVGSVTNINVSTSTLGPSGSSTVYHLITATAGGNAVYFATISANSRM
jgi:hypothetical protein